LLWPSYRRWSRDRRAGATAYVAGVWLLVFGGTFGDVSETDDEKTVPELIDDVRQRVQRRTFVQDVSDPLTGQIDRRKIAAKFNNLEHAVDELADAVEKTAEKSA
jgi:hypothetical protein